MKEFETTEPGAELKMLTELENLVRLPRPEYELKRADAAQRLDLPLETLDDVIANLRSQLVASTNGRQASGAPTPPPSTVLQANDHAGQYATPELRHREFLQARAVPLEIAR